MKRSQRVFPHSLRTSSSHRRDTRVWFSWIPVGLLCVGVCATAWPSLVLAQPTPEVTPSSTSTTAPTPASSNAAEPVQVTPGTMPAQGEPSPLTPVPDATPAPGPDPGMLPPPETSPDETAPEATPPSITPPEEAVPEPTVAPLEELVPPTGSEVDKGAGITVKGYFRSEFKFNKLNLTYAYDDALGRWTPRGSPYMAFGMLPPEDHDSYQELNVEARWNKLDNLSLYMDASAVYSTSTPVQTVFEQLQDLIIGTGDLSAAGTPDAGVPIPGAAGGQFVRREQERLLFNELYLTATLPDWASLTLGKRRLFYGSAFTWSPMDVINPPRNPLDPTLMREGSYNAALDITHFSAFTLSLMYKPKVTDSSRGIPEAIDFEKSLSVARLYTNLLETDINLGLYYNQGRPYAGLSMSRYFDLVEVHVESLFQYGRPTYLVTPVDLSSDPYGAYKPPFSIGQTEVENQQIYGDVLLGATYTMEDSSFIIAEYLHHSAGYSAEEYRLYRDATFYLQDELPSLALTLANAAATVPAEELAAIETAWTGVLEHSPYLYQEANVRKNYLGLSFFKSKMFELIEPKMSVILNLDDLSGTLYPSMDFVLSRESGGRGTVKLLAGAMIFFGGRDSQVTMFPNKFTANLRMTAMF